MKGERIQEKLSNITDHNFSTKTRNLMPYNVKVEGRCEGEEKEKIQIHSQLSLDNAKI